MKPYYRVLRKIIMGFLVVYLLMMGVFTFSRQWDIRQEYRNYSITYLNGEREGIQHIVGEWEEEDEIRRELSLQLASLTRPGEDFQVEVAVGVFKDGKCLAKTGYYLTNNGINRNLEELSDGEKYIDLEKYLSKEEIETFHKRSTAIKKDKKRMEHIEVEGYVKGTEVIPKKIEYYQIEKRSKDTGWFDEDQELVETYTFQVEDTEGLEPYTNDHWRIEGLPAASSKEVEEKMWEWSKKDGWEWQGDFWGNTYATYQKVDTEKGEYGLSFVVQFNAWTVAIKQLVKVYFFSGIVVILMTILLGREVWKIYRKQEQLDQERRNFVDAIAHELKTPLTVIQTYSEGLQAKIAEEKKEEYLEVILEEVMTMNELVLEMLELSKLENNAYVLQLGKFQIKNLIGDTLKNKEKLLQEKQIKVVVEIEEAKEMVADYRCMEKVVNNLLLNAIEHTQAGGKIYISLVENRVSIENEGLSIPEDKLQNIWDAFYKGEDIKNRSDKGHGLGLSIVRNILEVHHFSYGVNNTERGVKFWFDT